MRAKKYHDYDPMFCSVYPSNPWVSEDTSFWDLCRNEWVIHILKYNFFSAWSLILYFFLLCWEWRAVLYCMCLTVCMGSRVWVGQERNACFWLTNSPFVHLRKEIINLHYICFPRPCSLPVLREVLILLILNNKTGLLIVSWIGFCHCSSWRPRGKPIFAT